MRIAVTGSSGLIGSALRRSLEDDDHEVLRVVRSGGGPGTTAWDPMAGEIDATAFEGLDGVVNLAGEPIGPRRWNAERKARIMASRQAGTHLLSDALASCDDRPPVLVSGSGVDYYGSTGDDVVTEASPAGQGEFMTDVVLRWEAATAPAEAAGMRVTHLRSGVVLDGDDGALAQMLPIFKLGVGGRIGSGRQWMSWISIDDEVRAIRFALEHELPGAINATSPQPVTNAVFTKALGRALHRPTVIPVPSFAPMVLFGREMVEVLLLASHRVMPAALLDAGFEFRHDDLDTALRAVLEREG